MNIEAILVCLFFLLAYLAVAYVARRIACKNCPFKEECRKNIEKGVSPPCDIMSGGNFPSSNQHGCV